MSWSSQLHISQSLEMTARKACILLTWELIICLNLRLLFPVTKKEIEAHSTRLFWVFLGLIFFFSMNRKAFWEFPSLTASFVREFFTPSLGQNTWFPIWDTVPAEQRQQGQRPYSDTRHQSSGAAAGCGLVPYWLDLKYLLLSFSHPMVSQRQDYIFCQGSLLNASHCAPTFL